MFGSDGFEVGVASHSQAVPEADLPLAACAGEAGGRISDYRRHHPRRQHRPQAGAQPGPAEVPGDLVARRGRAAGVPGGPAALRLREERGPSQAATG